MKWKDVLEWVNDTTRTEDELRDTAKALGLSTSGHTEQLRNRIRTFIASRQLDEIAYWCPAITPPVVIAPPAPQPAPPVTPATPILPEKPQNLSWTVDETGVRLTWDAVTHAQRYEVFRKELNTNFGKIASIGHNSFTDITVGKGHVYRYYIVAVTPTGDSTSGIVEVPIPDPIDWSSPRSVFRHMFGAKEK